MAFLNSDIFKSGAQENEYRMKKISDKMKQNEDFLEKNPIKATNKGPLPEIRKRRVA